LYTAEKQKHPVQLSLSPYSLALWVLTSQVLDLFSLSCNHGCLLSCCLNRACVLLCSLWSLNWAGLLLK